MLNIPASKTVLVAVLSVLAIVGGVVMIVRQARKGSVAATAPGVVRSPYRSVGYGTAEEMAGLIGEQARVVVIGFGKEHEKDPLAIEILKIFEDTLRQQRHVIIAGHEQVSYEGLHGTSPGFPAEEYLDLLARYPGVDAVVSFASFPELDDRHISNLPQKSPRLLVVVPRPYPEVKQLLQRGVIQKAVIQRFTPKPFPTADAKTARQWFDLQWQVFTPETAASLPD